MRTAVGIARAGGAVGRVGVPQETTIPNAQPTFYANITIAGGPAPVRAYMHELMPDVLEGRTGRPNRAGTRVRPHYEYRRRARWLSCNE
jgi:threonine dehydrogenase-like Zn-dependent dehydrogenase